ncbi:MAG: APC family permease [Candidatus Micrarchaeaceae archaeon]
MKFKKVLGFWDLFWLGIGGMVGVAILTFPSLTYQQAGPASIISWIAAGIFSLFMAFVYSEMVTAFPKSGALVVFPYEAFGKRKIARYLAFLEGTGYYIGTVFGIVISAIILGNYIGPEFASGAGQFAIAEVSLVIVGIINMLGTRFTSRVNLAMSIFFMVIFAIIIVLGLFNGSLSNLIPFVSGSGLSGIVLAIPVAILAYGAWTILITIPEETADVKKIPKAAFWSIFIVTIFYALIVLAVYMNLSAQQMQSQYPEDPVLGLVALLHNGMLLSVFQVAAALSIMAVMLVMVLSNSRILYALTKLDFLPQSMNRMSGAAIPIYATLLSFIIPMALSAFPGYYFQYVVIGAIIGTGLPRVIDLAAYLKIRKRADYRPSFRIKKGVAVAAIAFFGLAISELSLGASDMVWSAAALVLLTGVFAIIDRNRK